MFKRSFALLVFFSLFFQSYAQDLSLYEKHSLSSVEFNMPYRVLLPENYDANKKYPLVYFLHGYGERGNDNEKQLIHGAKLFLREDVRRDFPAIVVFPQCSEDSYWSNSVAVVTPNGPKSYYFQQEGTATKAMQQAELLLEILLETYPVDLSRVYIGGLSMGGMGTFEMVRRHPDLFAAALPICGGGNLKTVDFLKNVNWWIFHGAKDNVVPPHFSSDMADALKKAGANVKFSLYPEANHNSWDPAFAEEELLPWLFSNKKKK
jgi:predicted peptidase